jgi:hypothetical protein
MNPPEVIDRVKTRWVLQAKEKEAARLDHLRHELEYHQDKHRDKHGALTYESS